MSTSFHYRPFLAVVEDTPENDPQTDVVFRPDSVRKGKPLRTAATVFISLRPCHFQEPSAEPFLDSRVNSRVSFQAGSGRSGRCSPTFTAPPACDRRTSAGPAPRA